MNYKTEVIEALTSGDYKQVKGYYKADGCYCTLGIMLDVYANLTGTQVWVKDIDIFDKDDPVVNLDIEDGELLPREVMEFYGISNDDAEGIADVNDRVAYTFPEIAEYIREEF